MTDLDDPHAARLTAIKRQLLKDSVKGFIAQINNSRGDNLTLSADRRAITQLQEFMESRAEVTGASENPLDIIESTSGAAGITPFRLVEITEDHIDPFLKYILYRNGLVAPKDYEPPCRMPDATIIKYGLAAFKFVDVHRQNKVLPVHILPHNFF